MTDDLHEAGVRAMQAAHAHGAGDVDPCELIGPTLVTNRAMRSGDQFFVRSSTTSGKWYRVDANGCSCRGYEYRRTCNHTTHLEKAGLIDADVSNGIGFVIRNAESSEARASKVTTGIRYPLGGASSEVEALSGQVRRLQAYAVAQRSMVRMQQRLVNALRVGDEVSARRAVKMVEMAAIDASAAGEELEQGDLVELAEE